MMGKFGRREGIEDKVKSKLRHGLMSVVVFDHHEVCRNSKSFVASLTNAAVSLANWSSRENNMAIKDSCTKLYEISCLICTIMESFSEEYFKMGNSLKELLHQEMELNAINKKVCQSEEKVTKFKKQNVGKEKKGDCSKRLSFLEDLGNAELEYEELKASLDVQNTKHEILKAKCLRDAITQLASGTTMLAMQLSTIGQAQKELANAIPLVPTQMTEKNEYQGYEHTDEIVQKTADALRIPRPVPLCKQQATKNLQVRKKHLASCFYPVPSLPHAVQDQDWLLVDAPHDTTEDPSKQDQQARFDHQMLTSLKNRLGIDSPHDRSHISSPAIEQRQVMKSHGLHSRHLDHVRYPAAASSPPDSPPPRAPKKVEAFADLPRVEPYAIGGRWPDADGLYARTDLFVSTSRRPCQSMAEESNFRCQDEYDNIRGEKEDFSISKDSLRTDEQEESVTPVYAVLERQDEETSNNPPYIDVIH